MRNQRAKIQTRNLAPPQVAVLVDTSTGWGRRLIQGGHNYWIKHGHCHLWVEPRGRSEALRLPTGWNGDGVIARISTKQLANKLSACGRPVVNVSSIAFDGHTFPQVSTNNSAAAKMAVAHFRNRGYH